MLVSRVADPFEGKRYFEKGGLPNGQLAIPHFQQATDRKPKNKFAFEMREIHLKSHDMHLAAHDSHLDTLSKRIDSLEKK